MDSCLRWQNWPIYPLQWFLYPYQGQEFSQPEKRPKNTRLTPWYKVHTVENSGFFCHSDFTWFQFWPFYSLKNSHFLQFLLGKSHQNEKFRVFRNVKIVVFELTDCLKLISRKILVVGNHNIEITGFFFHSDFT